MNQNSPSTPNLSSNFRLRAALGAAGAVILGTSALLPENAGAAHRPMATGTRIEQGLAHDALAPAAGEHHHAGHGHGVPAAPVIVLSYQGGTLGSLVDDLSRRSGIEFKVPANLSGDVLDRSASANTWADAVKELLRGYNYAGASGDNGKLSRVVVTGRNGNGVEAQPGTGTRTHTGNNLLAYTAQNGNLPERYRSYREGSVTPINIPFDRLHKLKIGEKVPLSLPTGEYEVVHDNAFEHSNGDKTWVGYLDQEGKEYRVVITSGKDGGVGQIISPDGEYQIDLENGGNYLVNFSASGLTHGSLEDDQAMDDTGLLSDPTDQSGALSSDPLAGLGMGTQGAIDLAMAARDVAEAMGVAGAAAPSGKGNGKTQSDTTTPTNTDSTNTTTDSTTTTDTTAAAATVDSCATTGPIIVNGVDKCSTVVPSVIDVLVVYTNGMNTTGLDTRLNQLFALTNQAYIDSKIVMAVRMVGKKLVSYTDQNANTTALSDLTYDRGAFAGTAARRTELGADLVTLIRPFYYSAQKNCGYAWVNGANGTALSASRGFAAVSDGTDRAGTGYYCNNYTFAHETGHNLGNVHERGTNAPTPGAYPFAYGWGKSGTVGTIMSYLRPLVSLFANPKVTCSGLACGVPTTETNSADNAATINLTGATVANFKPKMVP